MAVSGIMVLGWGRCLRGAAAHRQSARSLDVEAESQSGRSVAAGGEHPP
jgi:hypothetical protein